MKRLSQFFTYAKDIERGTPVLISQGQHSISKKDAEAEKAKQLVKDKVNSAPVEEAVSVPFVPDHSNSSMWAGWKRGNLETGWHQDTKTGQWSEIPKPSGKNWDSHWLKSYEGKIEPSYIEPYARLKEKSAHHPTVHGMIRDNIRRSMTLPHDSYAATRRFFDEDPEGKKLHPNYDLSVQLAKKFGDMGLTHVGYGGILDVRPEKFHEVASQFDNEGAELRKSALHHHLSREMLWEDIPQLGRSNLYKYTQSSSELNQYLFDNHNNGIENDEKYDIFHLPTLDEATNFHKIPDAMTVMSGVKFHPGEEAAKNPHNRIYLPAFTSTSIDKTIPHHFYKDHPLQFNEIQRNILKNSSIEAYNPKPAERHILHIHLPKGHPGAYVEGHSNFNGEFEMLLPRNLSLQVDPKPISMEYKGQDFGKHGISNKIHIWNSHPVNIEK